MGNDFFHKPEPINNEIEKEKIDKNDQDMNADHTKAFFHKPEELKTGSLDDKKVELKSETSGQSTEKTYKETKNNVYEKQPENSHIDLKGSTLKKSLSLRTTLIILSAAIVVIGIGAYIFGDHQARKPVGEVTSGNNQTIVNDDQSSADDGKSLIQDIFEADSIDKNKGRGWYIDGDYAVVFLPENYMTNISMRHHTMIMAFR